VSAPAGDGKRHLAVKSLSSRSERLLRAIFLSIVLDKIRNVCYLFALTESLPARHLPGPREESPRLFEMVVTTTAACEPGRRRIPYFLGRKPLKRFDSEK
jgi:hypothetical protein